MESESTFLVENMFFIVAAMLSGGMLLWPIVTRAVREVDPKRAIRLINYEDALILDVRDDKEYAEGHPPNATHIPVELLDKRWAELEKFKDRPIVIIFKPGPRPGRAGAVLRKHGFKRIFNLSGGIETWQRENLPLVKK